MQKNKTLNFKWGDLETFINVGAKISNSIIKINLNQTFTLNAGFIHQAKKQIADSTYVRLSYSKDNHAIVFEFTKNQHLEGLIKLTKKANITFSARSFFNYYQIDINTAQGKYEPELLNIPGKGECWVLFLGNKKT